MKTSNKLIYSIFMLLAIFGMTACVDHIPNEEELPSADVNFEYSIIDEVYQLDYYVGAQIQFVNTSYKDGSATWNFGDGSDEIVAMDTVVHKFNTTGTYNVTLTIENVGKIEKPIFISDIKPIMSIDPLEGGICEVQSTFVHFNVELPNPEGLEEEYQWIFPEGTVNQAGAAIETATGKDPGKIKFSNVGSQNVVLKVKLGGRTLEDGQYNVQVAYNKEVPTLYYAAKNGNIMALKLADAPEGMEIQPFNMGVKSGQHPFNILFNDSSLYILDAGLQFTYINDENSTMGDGRITIMSKDGSKVETMLVNTGNAFNDPFYGYIENNYLHVANRNTGFYRIALSERNRAYSPEEFPWFVQNDHLGYYGAGMSYGAMNACFGKVNGTWYWCKTFNGNGIFRFKDSDILKDAKGENDPKPADGVALDGMCPKSFAWDSKNQKFYFSIYDEGFGGIYACTLAELETLDNRTKLAPYLKTTEDGKITVPMAKPGVGEGNSGEFIGICQMALDEATGCVYFGYRSGNDELSSGLYRYNPATDKLEIVIKGVDVYGVAINNKPSKLF